MSAKNTPMLRNNNGLPIPQYFNEKVNQFEVTEGEGGSQYCLKRGNKVVDFFHGNTTVTKNYATPAYALEVINDGNSDLTIRVHSMDIVIKPGEGFESLFDAFTEFTITATGDYRATVLS